MGNMVYTNQSVYCNCSHVHEGRQISDLGKCHSNSNSTPQTPYSPARLGKRKHEWESSQLPIWIVPDPVYILYLVAHEWKKLKSPSGMQKQPLTAKNW